MAILIKKDIPHSAIAPREYRNEIDVVSVNLNLQDRHPLKISSFYNPNGSNDIKTMLELYEKIVYTPTLRVRL